MSNTQPPVTHCSWLLSSDFHLPHLQLCCEIIACVVYSTSFTYCQSQAESTHPLLAAWSKVNIKEVHVWWQRHQESIYRQIQGEVSKAGVYFMVRYWFLMLLFLSKPVLGLMMVLIYKMTCNINTFGNERKLFFFNQTQFPKSVGILEECDRLWSSSDLTFFFSSDFSEELRFIV